MDDFDAKAITALATLTLDKLTDATGTGFPALWVDGAGCALDVTTDDYRSVMVLVNDPDGDERIYRLTIAREA